MAQEFVALDPTGKERDWIDPVMGVTETETKFVVDNGYHSYEVIKQPNWKYITREKGGQVDG